MHLDISEEPFYARIYRNMPRHKIGPAQSKLDISDEPLMREFSRENAGEQMEHPDLTPALTLTVRTPQCGHMVWGKTHQH